MFNGYHRRRSFKGQHALGGILSFNVLLYCTDRLLFVRGKRKEGWVCCESDTIKVGRSVLSPTVFHFPLPSTNNMAHTWMRGKIPPSILHHSVTLFFSRILYKMWRHWRFTSHCYSNLVQIFFDIFYFCAFPTDGLTPGRKWVECVSEEIIYHPPPPFANMLFSLVDPFRFISIKLTRGFQKYFLKKTFIGRTL